MSGIKVSIYGVRGSIAYGDPKSAHFGTNTPCLHVPTKSQHIIFDAGTGIYKLGKLLNDNKPIFIFLSHFHWDHIIGLTMFEPFFKPGKRVTIVSPDKKKMSTFFKQMFDGYRFPVGLPLMASMPDFKNIDEVSLRGYTLDTFINAHPGTTFSFRLTHNQSKKVMCYCSDNEIKELQKDGSRYNGFVSFCKNADLGIFDTQYVESEYKKHVGWGHSTMKDVLLHSKEANVKRTIFFHHDPDRADHELVAMQRQARLWGEEHHPKGLFEMARESTEFLL